MKERPDDESGKRPAETAQKTPRGLAGKGSVGVCKDTEKCDSRLVDAVPEERMGGRAPQRVKKLRTIHRLPEATIQRIIELRQEEGWCHEAIAAYLNQAENINISRSSAYKILKRNHLVTKAYKPRRRRTYIRFTRQRPDSLWQTDIK